MIYSYNSSSLVPDIMKDQQLQVTLSSRCDSVLIQLSSQLNEALRKHSENALKADAFAQQVVSNPAAALQRFNEL